MEIPRIDKLLTLAKEGVGGERENAETLLDELLKRHGLTRGDLERADEPVRLYEFSVANKLDRELLFQIAFSVLAVNTCTSRGKRSKVSIEMTAAQHAEVSLAFDIYRAQWRVETNRLMHAFIIKHELFGPRNQGSQPRKPLDHDHLSSTMSFAQGLTDVAVRCRIAAPLTET